MSEGERASNLSDGGTQRDVVAYRKPQWDVPFRCRCGADGSMWTQACSELPLGSGIIAVPAKGCVDRSIVSSQNIINLSYRANRIFRGLSEGA
jgi:hypothetical protein